MRDGGPPTNEDGTLAGTDSASEVTKQSSKEAIEQDFKLVAEAHGWTLEEARAQRKSTQAVGRVAAKMAEERPEKLVGSIATDDPTGKPTLFVKGPMTPFITDLVDQADVQIEVRDHQPFSRSELHQQMLRSMRALEDLGYEQISGSVDVRNSKVRAIVPKRPNRPSEAADVMQRLPTTVQKRTTLEITDDVPVAADHASFGGMRNKVGNEKWCTTGWSVAINLFGSVIPIGGVTAGHCRNDIDGNFHPGDGTHDFIFQTEHEGLFGDVQWHSTPNVADPAQFYALNNDVRPTENVEPWSAISVGEDICFYSRKQGIRYCTLEVRSTWTACIIDGVLVDRLVAMNGQVAVPGDSGAGWFFGTTAYGVEKGICPGEIFTPVENIDDALNVFVHTQ